MQVETFLCEAFSVTPKELRRFLAAAPNKYKIYAIPKRTSGKRIIAHPAKELKAYQKAVVGYLGEFFTIHPCAYAYRKGLGIKANAKFHKDSRYLLKMDFQRFFHSITDEFFVERSAKLGVGLSENDEKVLKQLLFWRPSKKSGGKLVLSIGAPSSPFISNAMLYLFDEVLNNECKQQGIRYSRYADDLTFSTNRKRALFDIPVLVKRLLVSELDGFITINEAKTVFSSKANNRHVTGVTLTNEGEISLGRQRKRYISSLIHKYSIDRLAPEDFSHLCGLLAFANDIEPDFLTRMTIKYGEEVMGKLFGGVG